jgi:hypothetical protein
MEFHDNPTDCSVTDTKQVGGRTDERNFDRVDSFVLLGKGNLQAASYLMLYWEIIAVCSEIHTKNTNALTGEKVELLNVKPAGTYSDLEA